MATLTFISLEPPGNVGEPLELFCQGVSVWNSINPVPVNLIPPQQFANQVQIVPVVLDGSGLAIERSLMETQQGTQILAFSTMTADYQLICHIS